MSANPARRLALAASCGSAGNGGAYHSPWPKSRLLPPSMPAQAQPSGSTDPPKRRRETIKVACDSCRRRKLRCEEERPCQRCKNSNVVCETTESCVSRPGSLDSCRTYVTARDRLRFPSGILAKKIKTERTSPSPTRADVVSSFMTSYVICTKGHCRQLRPSFRSTQNGSLLYGWMRTTRFIYQGARAVSHSSKG
jgi:hypothetical protein